MVAFGAGEVIMAPLQGYIINRCGSRAAVLIMILITLVTTFVTWLNLEYLQFSWASYVMASLWGALDSAVNVHAMRVLGFEFESTVEPFGIFQLM